MTRLPESDVKIVQNALGLSADGILGPKTLQAMIEFLRKHGAIPAEEEQKEPAEVPATEDTFVHDKVVKIVTVFETGSPEGNYSCVSIYKDGGGGAYKQITYGKTQTTQDGHLDKLLNSYIDSFGDDPLTEAAKTIRAALPTKTKRILCADKKFIAALKEAGKEERMKKVQDKFFDETYYAPAEKWFKSTGFTLPLSMLVIFDSFIHSGGILSFLRNRFAEKVPSAGGDEKAWIRSYVTIRRNWLSCHSNKILRNTVYRMDTMQQAIKAGNWDLRKPVNANGVVVK